MATENNPPTGGSVGKDSTEVLMQRIGDAVVDVLVALKELFQEMKKPARDR